MTPFVTPRLVLMLVLSYMAIDTNRGEFCAVNYLVQCYREFIETIGWSFDVIRLDEPKFLRICGSAAARDSCSENVLQSKHCLKPPELNAVAEAINFLCDELSKNPDRTLGYYTKFRQCYNDTPTLNCTGMYPQVMPMAARHIWDKVETFLDMTYSESTESRILTGICIHMSTTRDISCSDFYLEMRCVLNAGRWHSYFKQILLDIDPDHLPTVSFRGRNNSLTTISLTDCSRVGDAKAIKACELSKKCVPVLHSFSFNVRFGVFTFDPQDLQTFCGMSQEELQNCVSKITPHCSLIDVLIFNGSLKVHEKLCSDSHKTQFLKHRPSLFASIYRDTFRTAMRCTDELMEVFKSVSLSSSASDERSVETTLCTAAATYLACLEEKLKVLCNAEAALWQRKMTRYMIVQAFQLTYCSSVFDFSGMDTSVEGQGPTLKVDELKTALLVVAATVVTCSHYIKRLYQV